MFRREKIIILVEIKIGLIVIENTLIIGIVEIGMFIVFLFGIKERA